ncbi:MAG TPA: hypothetical protein VLN59_08705 [Burkholderiales bacterium]|nr:hypothetical protein [Burkholderiales bacterium]
MSKKNPHHRSSARDPQPIGQQAQQGAPEKRGSVPPANGRLPHEHDEAADAGRTASSRADPVRSEVRQAESDVERGLKDTERRGIPNDIPYQERNNATRNPTSRS